MAKRIVFAALLTLALVLFAWTVRRFGRIVLGGRPANPFDRVGARVASVLAFFFGQKSVVEEADIPSRRWPRFVHAVGSRYHVLIFWGFLIITIGTGELLVQGLVPSFSLAAILGATAARGLEATIDTLDLAVLATIAFAVFRRVYLQPRLIPMSRDAAAILGGIATLMISHLGMHALGTQAGTDREGFPISAALGRWLPDAGAAALPLSEGFWWVHVVVLLAFLNYLLYSKHSHILAAAPNIYFRDLGQRGVLPKLDLEADDISKTGVVSEYKAFSWKPLLDPFPCPECARCPNACPAYNTGKPLSPMHVIHDVRDDLKAKMPDRGPLDELLDRFQHGAAKDGEGCRDPQLPMVGGRTKEETLWACTTCGACQQVCPVFIDQPTKIIEMRRNLVLVQEKVPSDLARTYKNLEQNGNPWGLGADKRMDWAAGKG